MKTTWKEMTDEQKLRWITRVMRLWLAAGVLPEIAIEFVAGHIKEMSK